MPPRLKARNPGLRLRPIDLFRSSMSWRSTAKTTPSVRDDLGQVCGMAKSASRGDRGRRDYSGPGADQEKPGRGGGAERGTKKVEAERTAADLKQKESAAKALSEAAPRRMRPRRQRPGGWNGGGRAREAAARHGKRPRRPAGGPSGQEEADQAERALDRRAGTADPPCNYAIESRTTLPLSMPRASCWAAKRGPAPVYRAFDGSALQGQRERNPQVAAVPNGQDNIRVARGLETARTFAGLRTESMTAEVTSNFDLPHDPSDRLHIAAGVLMPMPPR